MDSIVSNELTHFTIKFAWIRLISANIDGPHHLKALQL